MWKKCPSSSCTNCTRIWGPRAWASPLIQGWEPLNKLIDTISVLPLLNVIVTTLTLILIFMFSEEPFFSVFVMLPYGTSLRLVFHEFITFMTAFKTFTETCTQPLICFLAGGTLAAKLLPLLALFSPLAHRGDGGWKIRTHTWHCSSKSGVSLRDNFSYSLSLQQEFSICFSLIFDLFQFINKPSYLFDKVLFSHLLWKWFVFFWTIHVDIFLW